jgi:hypothetical protein
VFQGAGRHSVCDYTRTAISAEAGIQSFPAKRDCACSKVQGATQYATKPDPSFPRKRESSPFRSSGLGPQARCWTPSFAGVTHRRRAGESGTQEPLGVGRFSLALLTVPGVCVVMGRSASALPGLNRVANLGSLLLAKTFALGDRLITILPQTGPGRQMVLSLTMVSYRLR